MSKNNLDFFDYKYVFVFLCAYFVFIPFLFEVNLRSIYAFSLALFGIFAFIMGYLTQLFFKIKSTKQRGAIKSWLVYSGYFFLLHDIFFGFLNISKTQSSIPYTQTFAVDDYKLLYFQIVIKAIFFVKYFCFALLMSNSRVLFFIIFFSQFLLMFNSPTRLVALLPMIVFIPYGYYMNFIKVNISKVLTVIFLSPFVFTILLIARNVNENLRFTEIIFKVLDFLTWNSLIDSLKTSMESFKSFDDYVSIVNDNFIHIESGVVRIFYMFIPRDLIIDKPEAISRIISKEYNYFQYIDHGGSVATIFGDGFINGHIIGILFVLSLFGFMSKLVSNTVKYNLFANDETKSILFMFYSIYLWQFMNYFRGFFSELYWTSILLVAIFLILYKLLFRRVLR